MSRLKAAVSVIAVDPAYDPLILGSRCTLADTAFLSNELEQTRLTDRNTTRYNCGRDLEEHRKYITQFLKL